MDKLSAMATFVAVVESGSFSRAADLLSLPNARVSQRIADLERHLEVRLLQRTTRTLKLTGEGRAYFDECQTILQQINDLEGLLKNGASTPRGRVRVDALVSIARWIIAPNLPSFQARYPEISVQLGSSDHLRHLLEDGIDCAIRSGALESSSQIARHLGAVEFGLYAAPTYLAAQGPIRHPQDLNALQLISWFSHQKNPFVWQLHCAEERVQLAPPAGLSFDDPEVALAACMAGGGICPSAPFAAEHWLAQGLLVPVLPHWSFDARPIQIIYSSSKQLSARVRSFLDWMIELMHSHPSVGMTPLELARRMADLPGRRLEPSRVGRQPSGLG